MTTTSVVIALVFLCVAFYMYVVFPVWIAVACANDATLRRWPKWIWMTACIVLAPLGSWAYCLFTPQRRLFRITSWISVALTLVLGGYVTAFTNAEADAVREHLDAIEPRLVRAHMPLGGTERAEITADLAELRGEIHGGVMGFVRTDAASAVVDLLDLYLDDGRLTQGECDDWTARFKARGAMNAGALERRVEAASRDSVQGR